MGFNSGFKGLNRYVTYAAFTNAGSHIAALNANRVSHLPHYSYCHWVMRLIHFWEFSLYSQSIYIPNWI